MATTETNQVRFGLSNVHYAIWDSAKGDYGTPVAVKGAVNLSLDPEGDTSTFYADNGPYYTTDKNAGYTGTLEIASANKQMLQDLLGYELDDNGALVEFIDGKPAEFALLYEIDGDPNKQRGVLYSVKLSRPSTEHATTEDTADPATVSFDYTAIGKEFEFKGEKRMAVKSSAESGDAAYANWMTAVHSPAKASA